MSNPEQDVQNLVQLRDTLVDGDPLVDTLNRAIGEMKKLIPVARIYRREEYSEHLWYKPENEGGDIDWGWSDNYHNGPVCERCHHSFCVHCDPDGYNKGLPCVVEEFKCPTCGSTHITGLSDKCPTCNQVFIPFERKK